MTRAGQAVIGPLRLFALIALVLALAVLPASAQTYRDGGLAYDAGDYQTAHRIWHALALEGDPASQNDLGTLYEHGQGVDQDYGLAREWYLRAASNGDVTALFNLGALFDNGLGVDLDFETAARFYRAAAEAGDYMAQYNLGLMHMFGEGVPQSDEDGYFWIALAYLYVDPDEADLLDEIESWVFDSFYDLSDEEIAEIRGRAELWKPVAVARVVPPLIEEELIPDGLAGPVSGDALAHLTAGTHAAGAAALAAGDPLEAARLWLPLAEDGDRAAQYSLGRLYQDGTGVEQNWAQARRWYQAAAKQNHPDALFDLALMLDLGLHGAVNKPEAARLYALAAEQNNPSAMFNLGLMLFDGDGVAVDDDRAFALFRTAAEDFDYVPAMNSLGVMYGSGRGVVQDYALARQWYERAADEGYAAAFHNLGTLYDNGYGVEIDFETAAELYRVAADKGWAAAQYDLGLMYDMGEGVVHDPAEAYFWLSLAWENGDPDDFEWLEHDLEVVAAALSTEEIGAIDARVAAWEPVD